MIDLFQMTKLFISYSEKDEEYNKYLESIKPKETKKVDIDLVKIKDVVYAYSRENPQFLAQGYTRLEIVENLRRRFPDTTFMASPSNLKEVGFNDPI